MEEQLGTGIDIILRLLILTVFGDIVGWFASLLIKGAVLRSFKDIMLSIVGSIVGGWLFRPWVCQSAKATWDLFWRWSERCCCF